MPRLFLHFCGHSGVGKKTLVKKLVDDTEPGLRQRFGIDGPFGTYGSFEHPGVQPMFRYATAGEEIVVHSWQLATHGWIAHNERAYPRAEHRVYLLWVPYEIHRRQLVGRAEKASVGTDVHRWRPDSDELRNQWNVQYIPLFRQIEGWGFPVEVVDGSRPLCPALPAWPD